MPATLEKKRPAKKSTNDLIPGDVFLPGEILKDEIDARGITQNELAEKMGVSKTIVSDLIHGRRKITIPIAIALETALEIPAKFWANLQAEYDINVVRINNKKNLGELIESKVVIKSASGTAMAVVEYKNTTGKLKSMIEDGNKLVVLGVRPVSGIRRSTSPRNKKTK